MSSCMYSTQHRAVEESIGVQETAAGTSVAVSVKAAV